MSETAEGIGGRPLSDEKIVVPHQEVTLSNGQRVEVAPWGMKQGALVLERLDALSPKLFASDVTATKLLARAYDEVVDLVSLTVGIPRAEMEKDIREGGWGFEDLVAVTEVVLEVCIIRSDGRGALPLLLSLAAKMRETLGRSAGPTLARQQLQDSARKGNSKGRSANASASRKRPRKKRAGSRRS